LADGDRALAPATSNGFLVADITDTATALTLSPAGVGNDEYPATGYVAIGGSEIAAFYRDATAGNDADALLLLHFDGADGATATVDSSSFARAATRAGSVVLDAVNTARAKFLQSSKHTATSDFWTFPDSNDWTFAGDFEIEAFVYLTSLAANRAICGHGSGATTQYRLYVTTAGAIVFEVLNTTT